MAIAPGARIGGYEVATLIGAGGMGEVYRARDMALGREIALKVLPDVVAQDSERVARFRREAQLLAALNHPNVAAIYGLVEEAGVIALALELVLGQDLSQRLQKGPLPVEEALEVAGKIAGALEEAHEKGIVHRDLKPANVKVTPDGAVKVLDFGLAKVFSDEPPTGDSSVKLETPTLTRMGTELGMVLGTPAYMSPEQARGKPVDRRTDIWAFGVLLYELLTGKRLFDGETASDILAAVLKTDPDWSGLPSDVSPAVRQLLVRCVERDPKRRLRDIGEARLALEGMTLAMPLTPSGGVPTAPASGPVSAARAGRRVRPPRRTPWIGDFARENPKLTVLVIAILAITVNSLLSRRQEARTTTSRSATAVVPGLRVKIDLAPDAPLLDLVGNAFAVSPDGRMLAFVTGEGAASRLHLRRLDQLKDAVIPESAGAQSPFFSPDGQWIGFFASGKLKKAPIGGAAPTTLCPVGDARGGAWGDDDQIVVSPDAATGLARVSADGGALEPLTTLNADDRERTHRWPEFLPGGKHVLFMVQRFGQDYDDATIESVSLKTGARKLLHKGGAFPRYARSGHLLFARRGVLNAVRLAIEDPEVKGAAQPVVQELMSSTGNESLADGSAQYAISRSGTLVYRTGRQQDRESRLRLVDRTGATLWTDSKARVFFGGPRFSPDGTRLAFDAYSETGVDVFVHDLARHTETRLTFEANNIHPAWTPDGRYLTFASTRASKGPVGGGLYWLDATGAGKPELFFSRDRALYDRAWSPDGRRLAIEIVNPQTGSDIALLRLDGPLRAGVTVSEPENLAASRAEEAFPAISPDGRWLAFSQATDGGWMKILLRPFPSGDGLFEVGEGVTPRWSSDGKTLYFRNLRTLYATSVTTSGSAPRFGAASPVFTGNDGPQSFYDVAPNGKGFIMVEPAERAAATDTRHVVLALDWTEELKRLFERR